jgi:hypothetical protein
MVETTLSNIISYRSTDDDFDFTQETKISNSIAIRDPFSSDVAGSRCFEIDNYDKIENCDVKKSYFDHRQHNPSHTRNNQDFKRGYLH